MSASIYFLTTFYLQHFILVGPLILYGISFILLKNAGVRSKCKIAFLKKMQENEQMWNYSVKVCK